MRGSGRNAPRRVLITGAASGLGLCLAKEFLSAGEEVILTDIHAEPPQAVRELGGLWTYRKLDVTSDADWAQAAAEIDALDVLVNNAGIAVGGGLEATSLATWQRAIDINLLGMVRGAKALGPKVRRGGRLVFTASAAGLVHAPRMGAYNASKAAVVALAETLDAELRPRGVSVSVICPLFFKSGLADSLTGDDPGADDLARKLLSKTWLTSEGIARRSMRGIEARRLVITPDSMSTFTWYAKRYARIPFLLSTRLIGRFAGDRGQTAR